MWVDTSFTLLIFIPIREVFISSQLTTYREDNFKTAKANAHITVSTLSQHLKSKK